MKIMRCVKFTRCPIWLHSMLSNANRIKWWRAFSHDVTAGILCSKTMKRRSSVYQDNPVGVEFFSYANTFFCSRPINLHRCWPREWKLSIVSKSTQGWPRESTGDYEWARITTNDPESMKKWLNEWKLYLRINVFSFTANGGHIRR